jgi:hypothetical protein
MFKNRLLDQAISSGKAEENHGCYIIYPAKFSNDLIFNALLRAMIPDFRLIRNTDGIKAIPRIKA